MKIGRRSFAAAAAGLMVTALSSAGWAQAKPPIKIGLITPSTGPLGSYGKLQEILARLAVEDLNAKGGVNGSQIELTVGDSQTDPGQAVLLFRKFASEGYFGAIGPMTGTQWETVSPLANRIQMPSISINAIKPGVTVKPWTIRLQPPDDLAIPESFKAFLKAVPNVKTVVITADVREASSKAAADQFAKAATDNGIKVLATVEFSSKSTDLSAAAIEIKSHNPDAIMVAAFPAQGMLLAKEFETQRITVPVFTSATLWTGPFINNVGAMGKNWYTIGFSTNAEGLPGRTDMALYESVSKRVQAKADSTIGIPVNLANYPFGYDAILLYADILKKKGLDGSADPVKAREAIKDAFVNLKTFQGVFKYEMRDTGDAYLPMSILKADTDNKIWVFPQTSK